MLVKNSHFKSDQSYLWVELWHAVHGAHVGWVGGCRGRSGCRCFGVVSTLLKSCEIGETGTDNFVCFIGDDVINGMDLLGGGVVNFLNVGDIVQI